MCVFVSQMVLAELCSSIAQRLQQPRKRGVFLLHTEVGTRQAYLAETGAKNALAHNEGCTASSATLLGVVVGEYHSFFGNTVDVGCFIAHQALCVGADVALAGAEKRHR